MRTPSCVARTGYRCDRMPCDECLRHVASLVKHTPKREGDGARHYRSGRSVPSDRRRAALSPARCRSAWCRRGGTRRQRSASSSGCSADCDTSCVASLPTAFAATVSHSATSCLKSDTARAATLTTARRNYTSHPTGRPASGLYFARGRRANPTCIPVSPKDRRYHIVPRADANARCSGSSRRSRRHVSCPQGIVGIHPRLVAARFGQRDNTLMP